MLIKPELPRCSERVLTDGAMGRVAGQPCKRPAVRPLGLCMSHFRTYFGHRYRRGVCTCGATITNEKCDGFCRNNGRSEAAKAIRKAWLKRPHVRSLTGEDAGL